MGLPNEDLGANVWIQGSILIGINVVMYGGMVFWRYFPFINGYLLIIMNICLGPLLAMVDWRLFFVIKYLMIVPVLGIFTLFRIAFVPTRNMDAWKKPLSCIARFFGSCICRRYFDDDDDDEDEDKCEIDDEIDSDDRSRTCPCMQYFVCLILFVNILVAVIWGFLDGIYMNSMTGVLLILTAPIPNRLVYNVDAYFVAGNDKADFLAPMHWLWILSYTSWNACYIWHFAPTVVIMTPIHLLPCIIHAWVARRCDIWMELRLYCLALYMVGALIISDFWDDGSDAGWVLNGAYFPFLMNMEKDTYGFEIVGCINFICASVHGYIFFQFIKKQWSKQSNENEFPASGTNEIEIQI